MFEDEIRAVRDRFVRLAAEFQRVAVGPHVCVLDPPGSDEDFRQRWLDALGQRVSLIQQEAAGLQNVQTLLKEQPRRTEELVRAAIDLAEVSALQMEWTITHIDSIRRAGELGSIAVETTKSFTRGSDYIRDACSYAQGRVSPS